jgi:hypothetical protein
MESDTGVSNSEVEEVREGKPQIKGERRKERGERRGRHAKRIERRARKTNGVGGGMALPVFRAR